LTGLNRFPLRVLTIRLAGSLDDPLLTEATMPRLTSGQFEVNLTPQPPGDYPEEEGLARMVIEKTFEGDLVGTSRGQMLSAMSGVKGSAGYVAIERVSGTLLGKTGSFVLQHSGSMNRGVPTLSVSVVPDSGTGELEGISGQMTIDRVDGRHSYTFEYTLGDSA
jgi:hypothetical protein